MPRRCRRYTVLSFPRIPFPLAGFVGPVPATLRVHVRPSLRRSSVKAITLLVIVDGAKVAARVGVGIGNGNGDGDGGGVEFSRLFLLKT